jgi:small-conductance mechanosensitive channel
MIRLLILALFLLLAPVSQAADPPPAAPPAAALPAKSDALLAPLAATTVQVDRDSAKLIQKLTSGFQPWMWWLAGFLWAALVVLIGKLLEHGLARLFPSNRPSWLGRSFRVFCYVICALIAVYFFLHAFGASILAGPLLQVERKLVLLAAAMGIADVALLLVNLTIDRYLTRVDHAGHPIERSPRVLTILPLIRNIAMIALGIVLTLVVLDDFGVNISPLLAGAGVVGVAIGFGAQKLVQDVITGAFMLFENTMAIGDWVKIGDHSGTVEGMTIRTLRLRDAFGQVHTLPFSAVPNVINMSRDFGYHPFEINISYDTDVDRALAAIAEVGLELQGDPVLSADIVGPMEIFGVERLGEWSVVLSGRIKTAPARQAIVARVFNQCIKKKFDDLGLALSYRSANIDCVIKPQPPHQRPAAAGAKQPVTPDYATRP